MVLSLKRASPILGLWIMMALETCSAFVPQNRAFKVSQRKNLNNNGIIVDSSFLSTTTSLSMGVMEDFVKGTDEKTRKADNEKYLAGIQKRVDRINELEASIEDLGDDELQAKTEEFKARLKKGEDINGSLLEEAFAVVREAAWYVRKIMYL